MHALALLARRDWFAIYIVVIAFTVAAGTVAAGAGMAVLALTGEAEPGSTIAFIGLLVAVFLPVLLAPLLPLVVVVAAAAELLLSRVWTTRLRRSFRASLGDVATVRASYPAPRSVLRRSLRNGSRGSDARPRLTSVWPEPTPDVPLRTPPFAEVHVLEEARIAPDLRALLIQVQAAPLRHVYRRNLTFPAFTRLAMIVAVQQHVAGRALPSISAHARGQRLGADVPQAWRRIELQRESIDVARTHVLSSSGTTDELIATAALDPRVLTWCIDHPDTSFEAAAADVVVYREVASLQEGSMELLTAAGRSLADVLTSPGSRAGGSRHAHADDTPPS